MLCAGNSLPHGADKADAERRLASEACHSEQIDSQADTQPEQPLLTPTTSSSDTACSQSGASAQQGLNHTDAGLQHQQAASRRQQLSNDDTESDEGLPDAIKLGLGDFIFYSVLVGRAAMYDMLTAIVSYIAVMAGLGITLLLLALNRQALPALPVSIALGVLFYSLARFILEPFVLNLSVNLIFI